MTGKRFTFFISAFLFIIITSFLIIKIAKGYKIDLSQKTFLPTGLLVATSTPDGAQVFINGKLKSATNTTISLSPGTYEVEIKKEGYSLWKKTLTIEKELVTKTDAYLFLKVPDLKALTFTGAQNPSLSPDGTKLLYFVADSEIEKNGLWIIDLSELPFGISKEPRQILKNYPEKKDFSKATFRWSGDSKQILINLKTGKKEENFLIDSNSLVSTDNLIDVSSNLTLILKQWEKEENRRKEEKLKKLPIPLLEIIQNNTKDIIFSPDETKILYTATASAQINENLLPPVPAASTQKQERNLKPGKKYVFDLKEDRNFLVGEEETKLFWFPTGRHLLQIEKEKVIILEYDGTNQTTIYSGPFEYPFVFPFPSANKLLILSALGKNQPTNLYAVILR